MTSLTADIFEAENDKQFSQESLEKFLNNTEQFNEDMKEYENEKKENSTFTFWKQYMEMVQILHLFIRAEREGNWKLHIDASQKMLPYMATYDHVNYMCWGIIYLADMMNLHETALEVYQQFMEGNFVVEESEGRFNQVSVDLGLEHINKLCKVAGGIVGITRSKAALNRWMLTCCELSRLSDEIRQQAGLTANRRLIQKEAGPMRMARDEDDVKRIHNQFIAFNPFDRDTEDLVCISTNDVAPPDIREDLLTAHIRGKVLVNEFISMRLTENVQVQFCEKIKQNKSKTFAVLHSVQVTSSSDQSKSVKAGRDLFKRLFSAVASGRNIHTHSVGSQASCRPITSRARPLHVLLSLAKSSHSSTGFCIPTFSKSSITLSFHLFLGLPTGLLPSTVPSKIFLGNLTSSMRATCPNHLNLWEPMKSVI